MAKGTSKRPVRRSVPDSTRDSKWTSKTIIIILFVLALLAGLLLFANHLFAGQSFHATANPIFIHWWQKLGTPSQVAIIIAAIGGLFGLLKALIDKYPKTAFSLVIIVIIGFGAFLFWPAIPNRHDSEDEKMLYGKWRATFKMLGKYPWECTTVYNPDGKFMHTGLVSLPDRENQPLTVKGSWFAKDRHVYETIESAILGLEPMPMPAETRLEMRIINLDAQNFSYEDLTFHDGEHTMVKITH